MHVIRKIVLIAGVLLIAGVGGSTALAADAATDTKSDSKTDTKTSKPQDFSSSVTPQLYNVDTKLEIGTVLMPNAKDSKKVVPATQDKLDTAFALVVTGDNLPVTITNASSTQVYVATEGRHDALVTNENGVIKAGDYLAVSSLSGALMKSSVKQQYVFAKALASFDGKSNLLGSLTLKDTKGTPIKKIGLTTIPVAIQIIKNPETKSTKANLPKQLQRIGQAIAEKPVSPVRIYLSIFVIFVSIIIAIALLYAGVRSAIISIGRNPLSKKSIFRALLEVILTSVLVLIIGLFTVYLLIRL